MSQLQLPQFSTLDIPQLPEQLAAMLDNCRSEVAELVAQQGPLTWTNLMAPLEEIDDRLEKFWSPVSHLNAVKNTDELRTAYEICIPLITAYHSEMGQNRPLFAAVQSLADSQSFDELSKAQRQVVNNTLRDFRLSGVALDEKERHRFADIQQRLSELSTKFSNNVLDATDGWEKLVEDEQLLAGIPEMSLQSFRQQAESKDKTGLLLNLQAPSYLAVMQYADNRALRQEMYEAYNTRASDQGPHAGQWNNNDLMVEILQLREEKARLLGFGNYAELSLEPKMAESPEQVVQFLDDLVAATKDQGEKEFSQLQRFAATLGCEDLQAWDVPYYGEKLRQQDYAISQQELRPYFPAKTVIDGLFNISGQLFGIQFESIISAETATAAETAVDLWHPDAQCYRVLKGGEQIAICYLDLYARAKKRGGAWMADFCGRRRNDTGIQVPVAFLTCNFTPPTKESPALLTHDEVTTLFHEFGHGLHHMLTEIDVLGVSGINGVAWDAVELPSQFLENWCWQPESIPLISSHYQTGQPLPDKLLEKMLAARNFQSAMQMLRQLEFAAFDLRLHRQPAPQSADEIQQVLEAVRAQVAVIRAPAFNRFQNGFGHIFSGGYAAGYYSYKWAEVLSADAFSLFEEEGVMNQKTGRKFREIILEKGGSEDALDLFVAFRGRQPSLEALLRHSGIGVAA